MIWIQFDRICCLCINFFIIPVTDIVFNLTQYLNFVWFSSLRASLHLNRTGLRLKKYFSDQIFHQRCYYTQWTVHFFTIAQFKHLDFCETYWTCGVALLFSVGVADSVCLWMWLFWAKVVAFAGLLLCRIKICMDTPSSLGSISGPCSHVALLSGLFCFSAATQVFAEVETLALM